MAHRLRRSLAAALTTCLVTLTCVTAGAAAASAPDAPVGGELLGSTGIVVDAGAKTPVLPRVKAKSWLVADAESGDVLAAKAPHVRYRPASTLKILTALTLLDELPPAQVYRVRQEDAAAEGTRVGLMPGHSYTADQLFQGLLIASGNDAASAVANAAGGLASTVTRMNALAEKMQAYDTRAVNPSGLDADGQLSSAYDLALLGRAALANARFSAYATTIKTDFPAKRGKTFQVWTRNRLLYNYDGAIGVKSGFTTLARGTYVGAAERGGRTLVVSVMHTRVDSWRDAAELLDWGFAAASTVGPVGELVRPAEEEPTSEGTEDVPASGPTSAAAPVKAEGAMSTMLTSLGWVAAALAAVVVLLRSRVLIRRRRRRRARLRPDPATTRRR